MARVIRYLEDGIWKYASVKAVGDLEKLLTASKTDIVSAINELIANGKALETDLDSRFDGIEGKQNELVTITGNVQEVLGQVQGELNDKVEKMYLDEQMSKLVNKEEYDANYQKIEGELLDKVNIDKYNEEYQLVTGKLNDKADLSEFEGVKGRVATTEQEITNVKGELGSKIGRTEYDGAVGLNRWIARRYNMNIGSSGAIPSFEHIKGKQPNEIIDYDDNVKLQPFTGDYYIGHYFTNIYMKNAKTVTLNVTHDDGAVIYMNGAKMYEGGTRTTVLAVPMTFRTGWNTVEIIHYEHSGATEHVTLGVKLSTQVDKMTSVIGVGDKNETRLTQAETEIKQTSEAIKLKAEGSEVTQLGNRVTTNEGSISVMQNEIKSLVKSEDFNKYTGRLETAESTILQHSNQIEQKVEKTEHDALNNVVQNQQTSINQLTEEINLKATKSEYDGLNGRVGNAETQINLNTEAIKLKAEKTELDKTNGRLSTAEAQLSVQAGEIASKVTQEDIDESLSPIESRVGNAESTIVQHATAIGLKANANEVYKIAETDGKISTAVTQAKGEIKLETDKIALNVTNLTKTVTEQGTTISNHESSISQMKGAIDLRAEKKDVYTKTESDGKINTAVTNAKAEIKITTDSITQNVTNVKGDLSNLNDVVVAQGTQIKQTSEEVAINVVKKGNIMASLNASTEGIKILGKHLDITSLVTFQSLDSTMQSKVNAGTSAEQNAKNYTNLIASNESSYINKNYNFADWTGSLPNGFVGVVGATPTKVASENGNGNSVKFTTTAGQAGYFNIFSKTKPFYQYVYIETTFKLESGSINGAGVLFRYLKADGTSILYDNGFKFKDLVPSPVLNKWYTVSLVLKVNPSTDFGGYSVYPMASWSTFDSTMPANVIHFDSLITRPATEQEINSYESNIAIKDMSNDNKITPLEKQQLKKEWATISAEKPQYEALATTYAITTEKTNYVNAYNALNTAVSPIISNTTTTSDINGATFRNTFDDYYDKKAQLIKKINELSRSIGTSADTKAQEAKNAIADMSSDSKITPVEKVQLKKEWAVMLSEKPQYEALATTYGITTEKTNYVNAYNTLNTVLNGTGGILTNMTTTSAVTGATFRGQFDDYYDKKAQLVKKINETSKSLADGAQGTANTANNAINNNKAIWDRASNINSNGTFNSNKLSGLILDAQISSASNWNGAKSLLDSWKSGTTMINGGMIATNTIFAQQIAIGDFTNLSQINEEKNPNGYPTILLSNKRFFKIGNGAYASLTIMDTTYVEFKVNDEYYIAFNGYRDSGLTSLNLIMRYHYTDGTWANAGAISALPTTADTRVIKNLKITTAPDDTKTISRVQLFLEKDGTAGSGYYYIRDIEVRKRYTGELIVDGSIKAQQLDVNSLFAHSGFITNLKAQDIDASRIKTGQLIGIYIRSDGTNSFSYMSGGSIVSKSKLASVETWIDEGLIRVKSSTSMLSLSEDNMSIGQIGKSGYGSITYTAPNTDPAQNLFSIWGVGKIVLESNQSDIILKGRAYIQGVDSEGVSLNFPEVNSIRFDRYGNINAPSSMTSGATWSIKDGNGRVKLLVGVGKDSTVTSEYNAFGGGHAFNHNGERIFAIWKQGDANYVQQFAGQGILKWQKNQGRFEFRNGDDTNWSRVAGIVENASSRDYKKNISHFDGSALDIINASNARLYHYNNQDDSERLNIGLIAEEAPQLVQGRDGKSVDGYGMTTLAWKAIQELSEQVRYLNEKINKK